MRLRLDTRDKQPSPGSENFDRALALWDEGKTDEALSEFERAAAAGFRRDSIENNIGACYEKNEVYDAAERHYDAALSENPDNFFALKNMAALLSYLHRHFEAIAYYTKALAIDPDDLEIRIGAAASYLELNDIKKVIKTLRSILKEQHSPEVIAESFQILRDAGAFDIIVTTSDSLPKETLENDDVLRLLGEALFESGMGIEAVDCFRQLLKRHPDDAELKSWLGLSELILDHEAEAFALLSEAMQEAGDASQVLQNMAFALHSTNKLDEVIDVYERLVRILPDDWVIWNNWGNALYNLSRYRESIPKFVLALERNPDYEIAWNNIGNALEKMHLYEESIPFHRRAIEINDGFAYAHYALALALLMIGDFVGADVELRRSMSLDASFPESWILRARMKMLTSPEEGMAYAEEAVRIEPGSPETLMILASCQKLAGLDELAEKNLRMAKGLACENGDERILNEIEEILIHGAPAIIRGNGEFRPITLENAADMQTSSHGDETVAAYWYLTGVEMMKMGKNRRAIDAFRTSWSIDHDSVAALTILLRLETDSRRLHELVMCARELISRGLSTQQLEKALARAEDRVGTARG